VPLKSIVFVFPRTRADPARPSTSPLSQTRRRRYFENPQDIKKRKQSTPRKKKGAKPRTAAQALAEKEQAALNPGGRRTGGGFRRGDN
jgi:hypothetical protein